MTGQNRRFLRFGEICPSDICFEARSAEAARASGKTWFPYNKGGKARRWFGNEDYVINWYQGGRDLFGDPRSEGRNAQNYPDELKFKPAVTWSLVTSGMTTFRYKEHHLSDFAGMSFYNAKENLLYLLGFCNSKVGQHMLRLITPTLNYQVGDVGASTYYHVRDGQTNSGCACENLYWIS